MFDVVVSMLPLIALASVILTIFVGVMALRPGHYRNQKLTRRGRQAIVALVALGVATLISGFADRFVARVKENEAEVARAAEFSQQMASLRRVQGTVSNSLSRQERLTQNLGEVQNTLNESLARQERLAVATAENLAVGRQLQQQAQANTRNIVNRLVDETNRIGIAEVRAPTTMFCTKADRETVVYAVPNYLSIDVVGSRGEFGIYSGTTEFEIFGATFFNFQNHLGGYDTFPAWRGARAAIRLVALTPERRNLELSGSTAVEWQFPDPENATARGGCTGVMTLILNGRTMLMTPMLLRETAPGRFEGRVANVTISGEALPNLNFWQSN